MKCQGCQSVKAQVWVAESEAALCNGCSYVMGDVTRFRLCALCDSSPARIFCHNDNAALCDACDADIHLSNPLALRHDRVPLEPISAESVKESVSPAKETSLISEGESGSDCQDAFLSQEDRLGKAGAAIVTIPKAEKNVDDFDVFDLDSTFFGKDILDFGGFDAAPSSPSDGVVPSMDIVETASSNASSEDMLLFDESPKRHKHLDGFYPSHDMVTPYLPAMPTIPSAPAQRVPTLSPRSSCYDLPTLHLSGDRAMDREARVMRYREKRKRRTFEKTIRYQSRKAYAEVRPRIKGRFATKEEVAAMKATGTLPGSPAPAMLAVLA
ncbi:g7128 [Coccomyxa viridis]|uniref:G7128 protein n=1 Tax=Coccomyxa viridis TaxID=1274662 RepID=A0ABP1G3M4_9CHLO